MNLLNATTRYYLLLALLLFVGGSLGLYYGINWALRTEVSEQLADRRRELLAKAEANELLPVDQLAVLLDISRTPRPLGFRDTVLLDRIEHEMVPHRQLTFPLTVRGEGPVWVSLRKSLVEAEDLLGVVLAVMLSVLALLLGGMVALNRWLSSRLWAPFRHTLAALRQYDLQQHRPLALPAPAVAEFAELNQALNGFSQRLVTDYEHLREFTANAAHETQTPLAIMQAQLEQLLQVPALAEDPAAAPLVADLYGATLRLSRLHQALSLLSKIENRQFAEAQPVRLDQLLEEKVAQLEPLFEARELRYGLDVSHGPVVVQMHPGLADSLLQNLLQNAVKHNVRGGELAVSLSKAELKVTNTGPAVEGDPARFFERFRKHNAASESPGLGLSIVQQICGYYGFGVDYSVAKQGTRHTLRVSLSPTAGVPAKRSGARLAAQG
ncbi:HAMP domain-containing histidine kinase [Microvirga sp. STS02]|uniref:sensor histidine kinase n=1 Tax=Hymenobacter negativus TaxID=2795026 RepID=UPI0018DB4FE9|nr:MULTISPECIES: HAMP domain-containing sensor histidine kinase [Bacteria]MBH8571109.1 HAMP domain-containing histidine kinase [Hymenobacter negativus]MBR7210846.1 HAMP domain-containing histidine kinase [Microvirga sp. STS02]